MSKAQSRPEHYADSNPRTVRYSRRAVVRALEAGHVGRQRAIQGRELASFVPVAETTVRDVIAELRDDPSGPPIGQCSDGYYVISDHEELEGWIRGVKEEIATKWDRLRANVESFNRHD
jgi:predicted TIM-barrel enzyme